jgi:hypothetical protein
VWLSLLVPLVLLLGLGLAMFQASGTIARTTGRGVSSLAADTPDSVGDHGDTADVPDVTALTAALVALVVLGMAALALGRLAATVRSRTSSPLRSGGEPCRAPPVMRLL